MMSLVHGADGIRERPQQVTKKSRCDFTFLDIIIIILRIVRDLLYNLQPISIFQRRICPAGQCLILLQYFVTMSHEPPPPRVVMILTLSSPSLLQLDLLVYCPLTSPQNKRGDLDLESWEAKHLAGCAPRWSRATRPGSALETAAPFRFSDWSALNSYMGFIETNICYAM